MDADPAGEWLTISAAARRLGVTRRAIQKRIERNTLRWRPDGNKGRLVLVAHSDGRSDDHGEAHGDDHSDLRQRLAAAEREVELVREMLEAERERHREALADARAERDRMAELLRAALDRPSWLERLARALRGRKPDTGAPP